jgi:hypothetical protein
MSPNNLLGLMIFLALRIGDRGQYECIRKRLIRIKKTKSMLKKTA